MRTLLLSNNEISKIDPNFGVGFPRLENLVLTNNKVFGIQVKDFAQIDSLAKCKTLKRLSLLNNAVTSLNNYRLYVISKVPSITALDFQKVKMEERKKAKEMFGENEVYESVDKKRKLDEDKNFTANEKP